MEEVPLLPLPPLEERVKLRKELMGLPEREAADEIGIARGTLRRIERGKPMNAETHRRYQAALTRWQEVIDSYTQQ